MYCRKCGSQIEDDSRFCLKCGYQIRRATISTQITQQNQQKTTYITASRSIHIGYQPNLTLDKLAEIYRRNFPNVKFRPKYRWKYVKVLKDDSWWVPVIKIEQRTHKKLGNSTILSFAMDVSNPFRLLIVTLLGLVLIFGTAIIGLLVAAVILENRGRELSAPYRLFALQSPELNKQIIVK